MDCQVINNKSCNSIPETLDLHYMSIIRAVIIIITTLPTPPTPPHPRNLYTLYYICVVSLQKGPHVAIYQSRENRS